LAVGVAEVGLQDLGFAAGADDLQGDYWKKDQEKAGMVQVEDEAGDEEEAEDVDGVANAGIESVGDQGGGSRRDEKELPSWMRARVSSAKEGSKSARPMMFVRSHSCGPAMKMKARMAMSGRKVITITEWFN
jgi:hypothetical protein